MPEPWVLFLPDKHRDVKPENIDFYCTANPSNVLITSWPFDRQAEYLKPCCNAMHELIFG